MLITIDGHAGAGKTTQGGKLASALDIPFVCQPDPVADLDKTRYYVKDTYYLMLWGTLESCGAWDQRLSQFQSIAEQPVLSFYLEITLLESYNRTRSRFCDEIGMPALVPQGEDYPEADAKNREIWRYLEAHLEHLHIVDGMQSSEQIFEQIRSIIGEQLCLTYV